MWKKHLALGIAAVLSVSNIPVITYASEAADMVSVEQTTETVSTEDGTTERSEESEFAEDLDTVIESDEMMGGGSTAGRNGTAE